MDKNYEKIKGVLFNGFVCYLDENRLTGKKNPSYPECQEMRNAFDNQDWETLANYAKKYLTNESDGC